MDNDKKLRILKKNNSFIIIANSVILISVFFMIIVLWLWWALINEREQAPLVIESDGTQEAETYTDDQQNTTFSTTGYEFSGLNMPCVQQDPKGALPNLPGGYKISNCDELDRKICVENLVQGGGICLSSLGGSCQSLYDCAPGQGATACLNNVCVNTKELDTINQPCVNDFDCQTSGQNHICDPSQKICKVNYFPYETGCIVDEDCLSDTDFNKNACINIDSTGLDIKVFYQNPYLVVDDETQKNLVFFRKNITISVLQEDNSFSVYRLTTNLESFAGISGKAFNSVYISGKILQNGNISIATGSTGGRKTGICVSKIPRGGKIIDIAGVSIPCEDGLINVSGFCVKNIFYSEKGIICDKRGNMSSLECDPISKLDVGTEEVSLTCLGTNQISEDFSQNFNYTYPSLTGGESSEFRDEIKHLGYCGFPTTDEFNRCDPDNLTCKPPYICITATDKSENPFSFCSTDFNRQECVVNSDCPTGYDCKDSICLSEKDNICILDGDCENGDCGDTKYLYQYDISQNKYVRLFEIPSGHGEDIKIRNGKDIVTDRNQYQFLPQKFMVWSVLQDTVINRPDDYRDMNGYQNISDSTYSSERAVVSIYTYGNGTYTNNTITVNMYPVPVLLPTGGKLTFVDFLLNGSGEIYGIYSKQSKNDRKRSVKITSFIGNGRFRLGINSGFNDGDEVIYKNGISYPQTQNYYIRRENSGTVSDNFTVENFYLSLTKTGSVIIPDSTAGNLGEIESTSNVYYTQMPQQTDNVLKSSLIGASFENGDMILTEKDKSIKVKYQNSGEYDYTGNNSIYLSKTSDLSDYPIDTSYNTRSDLFFYHLTDSYQESQGSVPFVNGQKTVFQEIYYEDGFTNLYLNPESHSYSIFLLSQNQRSQYVVENENYVQGNLNGINSSLSYNFDNTFHTENEIDFSIFTRGSLEKILISKKIEYQDISTNNSQEMTVVQRAGVQKSSTYTIGDLETKMYYGGQQVTTYFSIDYESTSFPPIPKGLYFDSTREKGQNKVETVKHSQIQLDIEDTVSLLSGYANTQPLPSNNSPTTIVVSESQNISIVDSQSSGEPPQIEYDSSGIKTDYISIEMIDIQNYDGKSRKNTYQQNSNILEFRNGDVIDIILSYGWSEIVFSKIVNIESPTIPGTYGDNILSLGQISLVVVGIESYDVTPDSEILTLKVNVPLVYDYSSRKQIMTKPDILQTDPDMWRMYVNNIYPLVSDNITLRNTSGQTYNTSLYTFFDSSALYTSTKNADFFSDNDDYSPTSYNKIFTTLVDTTSDITMIYVNDGYGSGGSHNYDQDEISDGSNVIYLPNMIPYQGSTSISLPTIASGYPDESLRTNGTIFCYFYPVSWNILAKEIDSTSQQTVFSGKSYISEIGDYKPLDSITYDQVSFIRPLNSGVVWFSIPSGAPTGQMYATNNLYLSTIPKSITNRPYFNTRIVQEYFSLMTKGKNKGSLTTGINSIPYFPRIGNITYTTLGQCYRKIASWPEWIEKNGLTAIQGNPEIKKVYFSSENGNLRGDFTYYVLAKIGDDTNLYRLSSNNSSESFTENQGVPLTKSVYQGSQEIESKMIGQNIFMITGSCRT